MSFRFMAYGILAVAALALLLFAYESNVGHPEVGAPFLYIGLLCIVLWFIVRVRGRGRRGR